jgi:hypothetical protein
VRRWCWNRPAAPTLRAAPGLQVYRGEIMWAYFERLLDSSMFSPHGICLLWEPELIWLHVVSDACIALAYFSIPFALAILVTKRRDLQFGWVFWAFAVFIMA